MSLRALPLTDKSLPGGRPREDRAPSNAFADWCRTCNLTADEIAEKLGKLTKRPNFSVSSVYNLRNGYFKPGRGLAVAIETLTKRKVPVSSWDKAQARPRKKSV